MTKNNHQIMIQSTDFQLKLKKNSFISYSNDPNSCFLINSNMNLLFIRYENLLILQT